MTRAWEPTPLLAPAAGVRIARLLGAEEPDAGPTTGARRSALAFGGIFAGILAFGLHADPRSGFLAAPATVPPARFEARSEESDMTAIRIPLAVATAAALSVAAASPAQEAVQWRVEDGGNGNWYQFVNASVDWSFAVDAAVAKGAHLATLSSAAEAQLLRGLGSDYCWIGLYQDTSAPSYSEPAGGWRWITSEPLGYSNWRVNTNGQPNEPNDGIGKGGENWALLDIGAITWNDVRNNVGFSYCMEWSADCNADGIVDYGQCRDGSLPDYNGNNIPDCCESGTTCVVGNYPVQWRVEDGGNGHWYQAKEELRRWTAARASAQSMGGDLACLESPSEWSWVRSWINPSPPWGDYLVGGRQSDSASTPGDGWFWTSGVPVSGLPVDFDDNPCGTSAPGVENGQQDFLHICCSASLFGDINEDPVVCGDGARCYLIEWSADCNDDGIVDYGQILQGQLVDADSNGIPDVCEIDPCPGDINDTGVVNATDLAIILGAWGTDGGKFPRADTNRDGTVDALDLAQVLSDWGPCP